MESWENEYPLASEYVSFYATYVRLVPKGNIIATLSSQLNKFLLLVKTIPSIKEDYAYDQGKWTLNEVIGHMIETERLFSYRAFAISRGDKQALPGMDQNEYMAGNNYNSRTLEDLADEFKSVRESTIHLLQPMTKEMISEKGTASGVEITVRALAFIMAGHELHHLGIVKDKYLTS